MPRFWSFRNPLLYNDLPFMEIEDIQEIIAKDEHRCLELKKTIGELPDGDGGQAPVPSFMINDLL